MNQDPQLKKEMGIIQNDLLWLFLKYNLAFHCNVPSVANIVPQFREKKNLFVHCLLHAVIGNSTDKDPVIKIGLAQTKDNKYWLEITSSGAPESFFFNLEEYSNDLMLKKYAESVGHISLFSGTTIEPVEISACDDFSGSKIRFRLN